jgi:hypothetical protein
VPAGLDLLTAQLWSTPVAEGWARVYVDAAWSRGRAPHSGWRDVETYWAVPSARRLRLLVPAEDPRVTAASLARYRQLRRRREAAVRTGLAGLARVGLPVGTERVRLQVRAEYADQAATRLPLGVVAQGLGRPLYASIGVRRGVNGKPTLQLLDHAARPAGFAKLGWNAHTDDYVRVETHVLTELSGGSPLVRTPPVLAAGDLAGHPWLVTGPLPGDAGALRGDGPGLSVAEMVSLSPVVRSGPVTSTGHWIRLADRLATLGPELPGPVRGPWARLAALLHASGHLLPVGSRWHGDLTPWNCARDGAGTLWLWDWETSEPDVVAGLDAVHWAVSVQRERLGGAAGLDLAAALGEAQPTLLAAGVAPEGRALVGGVYAATVADRAVGLAARAGWERSWIGPEQVADLLSQAESLVQRLQSS